MVSKACCNSSGGHLFQRAVLAVTRIVDENGDGTEALFRGLDRGPARGFIGDIERQCLAAEHHERRKRIEVPCRRDGDITRLAKDARGSVSEAAGAAGDQHRADVVWHHAGT